MLLLIAVVGVGVGLFVFFVEPLAVLPLLERLTPRVVYRVQTTRPLVALSFDDGPHPIFTPQVLDILANHDVTATFFLIGERASRHPEILARIKAAGHEVANHYYMNGSVLGHPDDRFVQQLTQTEAAIGVSEKPKLFRAPGGVAWSKQLKLANVHGYTCVLGSAYPHDPMHPPIWYMRWLVEKNLVPGTIVILHDGISDARHTIETLPHILDRARKKGLSFVSIGKLMRESSQP